MRRGSGRSDCVATNDPSNDRQRPEPSNAARRRRRSRIFAAVVPCSVARQRQPPAASSSHRQPSVVGRRAGQARAC